MKQKHTTKCQIMTLEPPKLEEDTIENTLWSIWRTSVYGYAITNTGPSTYAGNLASYPQTISTSNQPNLSQASVTLVPLGGNSADFSFTGNSSGEWFGNLTQLVLDPQEEGGFVAYSNEYPGAIGQGETEEEALRDLQEAIDLLKEVLEQDKKQE